MSLRRLMFGVMYRIGFTPWEGHGIPERLRQLADELPRGKALDLGCGTGDASIYMAQHGWTVTAVDLVQRAIDKAKEKSARAGVEIRFLRGDVTQLGKDGAGSGFDLIEDSGCLHGLPDHLRDAYVREVTAAAAARATLLIFGFTRAKRRRGPQGVERDEIERRFGRDWELVWSGLQKEASNVPDDPIYGYELRRRSA